MSEATRKYYAAHRDQIRAYQAKWRKQRTEAQKDARRERDRERYAAKVGGMVRPHRRHQPPAAIVEANNRAFAARMANERELQAVAGLRTATDLKVVEAYFAVPVYERAAAFKRLTPVQQRIAKEMYKAKHRIGVAIYEG